MKPGFRSIRPHQIYNCGDDGGDGADEAVDLAGFGPVVGGEPGGRGGTRIRYGDVGPPSPSLSQEAEGSPRAAQRERGRRRRPLVHGWSGRVGGGGLTELRPDPFF